MVHGRGKRWSTEAAVVGFETSCPPFLPTYPVLRVDLGARLREKLDDAQVTPLSSQTERRMVELLCPKGVQMGERGVVRGQPGVARRITGHLQGTAVAQCKMPYITRVRTIIRGQIFVFVRNCHFVTLYSPR